MTDYLVSDPCGHACVVFINPDHLTRALALPEGIEVRAIETVDFGRKFRALLVGATLPAVVEGSPWPEGQIVYTDHADGSRTVTVRSG